MQKSDFSHSWQFQYGPGGAGTKPDSTWTTVVLPHDASIALPRREDAIGSGSNAFYPGAVCWYEKELALAVSDMGKTILLEVEGAYMNAAVLVNGHLAGRRPYGYSSFHNDLTPWLKPGANRIRVEVNNGGLANTRWYSGSGLYRNVRLLTGDTVRIEPWSLQVVTPEPTQEHATVDISLSIRNDRPQAVSAWIRLELWPAGLAGCEAPVGEPIGSLEIPVSLAAGDSTRATASLQASDIGLWSPETPALYHLTATVREQAEGAPASAPLDAETVRFGFRSVSVDAANGFRLNGIPRKLKGGCVHHDCGLLGAAAFARAEERKVRLLKASGFDAVRCAHNPPSPAFLDACDRLGMLVIDEAFDCWRHGKNPGDYSLWFDDWWQRDLTDMVRRDFNHPSIVMWSTGNEIIERDGRSGSAALAREMADTVRALDPTRPITNALCDLWEERHPEDTDAIRRARFTEKTAGFAEPLDVVGWNYLLSWYGDAPSLYPDRPICGTETFPKDAFDYWEAVERHPHVIGDFVWTSMDYLGEAGIGHVKYKETDPFLMPFPWHHANCGDIDICGTKRPQSHYRDCVWGVATTPYLAVHAPERHGKPFTLSDWGWPDVEANWTWPGQEGKPCTVDVYSRADAVALLLDGVEQDRKPAGKANRYLASFETTYQPGRLEAVEYTDGIAGARTVLDTAGPAASIHLTADCGTLCADPEALAFVRVDLLDAQGRPATHANHSLHVTVHGAGTVLAVGNGDPASTESFVGNTRSAWRGKATVVVRGVALEAAESENGARKEPSAGHSVVLTVSGEGLAPATLRWSSVPADAT